MLFTLKTDKRQPHLHCSLQGSWSRASLVDAVHLPDWIGCY